MADPDHLELAEAIERALRRFATEKLAEKGYLDRPCGIPAYSVDEWLDSATSDPYKISKFMSAVKRNRADAL